MKPRLDVQPVDKKGAIFAAAALGFAALYQALWYIWPGLMQAKIGSVIPFSVPFGVIAIFVPLLFAWLCARDDKDTGETFETAKH
ncbi:MAG: hypothetical protein K2P94_08885 [Rhodospirillaceae bacterium]|nr:hypothetical protein [Rhodospirillaceae bacterium]